MADPDTDDDFADLLGGDSEDWKPAKTPSVEKAGPKKRTRRRLPLNSSSRSLRRNTSATTLGSSASRGTFNSKDDALSFLEQEEAETLKVIQQVKSMSQSNSLKDLHSSKKKKRSRSKSKSPRSKRKSPRSARSRDKRERKPPPDPDEDLFGDLEWSDGIGLPEGDKKPPTVKIDTKPKSALKKTASPAARTLKSDTNRELTRSLRSKNEKKSTLRPRANSFTSREKPTRSALRDASKIRDTDDLLRMPIARREPPPSSRTEPAPSAATGRTSKTNSVAVPDFREERADLNRRIKDEVRRSEEKEKIADELRREIENLRLRCSDLDNQWNNSQRENVDLRAQIRQLTSESGEKSRHIGSLEKRLQDATRDLSDTRRMLDEKHAEFASLASRHADEAQNRQKAHQRQLEAMQTIQTESGSLRSLVGRVDSTLGQLDEIKRSVTSQQRSTDQERHEQILIRENMLREKDDNIITERKQLQKMLIEFQDLTHNLKTERSALKDEQARLKTREDLLITEFQTQNREVAQSRERLNEERRELQQYRARCEKEITTLREEAFRLKNQYESKLAEWRETQHSEQDKLERDRREWEAERVNARKFVESARQSRMETDRERRELEKDIEDFESKMQAVNAMSEKIAVSSDRITRMHCEATAMKEQADAKQADLVALEARLKEQERSNMKDRENLEQAQLAFLQDKKEFLLKNDLHQFSMTPAPRNRHSAPFALSEPRFSRAMFTTPRMRQHSEDDISRKHRDRERMFARELRDLQESASVNRRSLDAALQEIPTIKLRKISLPEPFNLRVGTPAKYRRHAPRPQSTSKIRAPTEAARTLTKNWTAGSLETAKVLSGISSQASIPKEASPGAEDHHEI